MIPVKRKNGKLRLCVDLRPLNSRVAKQKYPFPLIEDCLSRLCGKTVFTLLDLKDGFHQIRVHPDHTQYFAFATPDGQFEYNYLPFGYSEAPAEFQRRILQILDPLVRGGRIVVYMDDILIATESVKENLGVLKEIMIRLKTYSFELNLKKCQFLKKKIEFLGYIVSQDGITLSPRHTEAIRSFRVPRNVHELQRFLGLVSYFRKFTQDFSLKARPLYDLLRKNVAFKFDSSCIESFESLKDELTRAPTLALYNPEAETELHTDASSVGLGAILLQKQANRKWSAVAYYSQTTNKAEKQYHSYELEMLAVVRAIERFHLYLYGIPFTIVTDCNAIVYAVNKASLNPRIARWTLTLQNYDFKMSHRPGDKMQHVDALSRCVGYVGELPLERELEFHQLADPRIKEICDALELEDSEKFEMVDGLLYRKLEDRSKFVIPESMVASVIRAHHDDAAHVGYEKTLRGISENFWFPAMRKRVRDHISNCLTCVMANDASNRFEGETSLYPAPTAIMQVVHVDHFGPLAETPGHYKHILVVVDAFSRFTWLTPVKSTTSRETIHRLEDIFSLSGNPAELVSDRGTAFTSREFIDFIDRSRIKHRKVAVAAPWANGIVERVNRFIKGALTKILDEPDQWSVKLPVLQYLVNNTFHAGTETTPSKIVFGYDQRNHSDYPLARFTKDWASIESDLESEKSRAHEAAYKATERLRNYNKMYRDSKSRKPSLYCVGEYVLIRDDRTKPGENSKLKAKYKGPYVIEKVLGNNRYVVKDIPGFNITSRPLNTILSSDRIKRWVKVPSPAGE